MASSKRERELARRRLERQAARRAAHRRRRQQYGAIGGSVVAVLAVIGVIVGLYAVGGGDDKVTAATGSPTPNAVPSGQCAYSPAGKAAKDVGTPPATPTQKAGTETATITTNRGDIEVTLLAGKAPCTVNSFSYLAGKGYFAGTPCHRLTTSGIYVLQCGDPTGTGGGGPGYEFGEENLGAFGPAASGGTVTYPAGTVAMANAGKGTNGSQFFLVYKDSPLAPSYTPFGRITKGLDILQSTAKAGVEGGGTDGKPAQPVTITKVAITGAGPSPAGSASPSPSTAGSASPSPSPAGSASPSPSGTD